MRKNVLKIILIFIILAPFFYMALISHFTNSKSERDFSVLYEGLKDKERTEYSFKQFANHDEKAGDYLSSKLASEEDDLTKINSIQIIGEVGCTNCAENLGRFLKDPNWRVRFFTIEALDKLNYDKIHSTSKNVIINDENENVVIKAIMILGLRGNKNDITFLENLSDQEKYRTPKINKTINIAKEGLK